MQFRPLCTPDVSVNSENGRYKAVPVRCKRWSCEVCREMNRRRVIRLAKRGLPTAMLTLTVSSKHYDTPDAAAADLKRGLVALRKRINRKWPEERMPFLAVFEQHKSGYPHLHLLIRARFIPVDWLREVWTEITGSWNVNICSLKTRERAAAYAAKYIGKDLAAFANCKRWWRSHDYDQPQPEDVEEANRPPEWSRWEADLRHIVSALRALGAEVSQPERDVIVWTGPPDRDLSFANAAALARAWFPASNARPIRFGR